MVVLGRLLEVYALLWTIFPLFSYLSICQLPGCFSHSIFPSFFLLLRHLSFIFFCFWGIVGGAQSISEGLHVMVSHPFRSSIQSAFMTLRATNISFRGMVGLYKHGMPGFSGSGQNIGTKVELGRLLHVVFSFGVSRYGEGGGSIRGVLRFHKFAWSLFLICTIPPDLVWIRRIRPEKQIQIKYFVERSCASMTSTFYLVGPRSCVRTQETT